MIFLQNIQALVNTLLTRLTATRAANLDDLDTTVSSRAPSSTAVSNANYTTTRAGYLDLINTRLTHELLDAIGPTCMPTTSLTVREATANWSDIASLFDRTGIPYLSTTVSQPTWATALNVSGEGVANLAAIANRLPSTTITIGFRVVIDGTNLGAQVSRSLAGEEGIFLIGTGFADAASTVYGSVSYQEIPFRTEFKIEYQRSGGTLTTDLRIFYAYRLTGSP